MRAIFTPELRKKMAIDFIFRENNANNWATIVLVVSLLILATARLLKENSFQRFIALLVSDKYLIIAQKQRPISSVFNMLLTLFQLLSLGLFIHIVVKQFYAISDGTDAILLLQVITICFLFTLGKFLVERIIGVVFSMETLMDEYLFCKLSYRNYLGMLVLPMNGLLLYAFPNSEIAVVIFGSVLILGNLLSLVLVFKMYSKLIFGQLFYFILYLCTLEIAPYYILYKLFEV